MELLHIQNVSKSYGDYLALDNISLTIGNGLFGLLGPNGAGKSTLMRTIAGLQTADSGSIMLGEIDVLNDPQTLRKQLGYLPQEFGVFPHMSAAFLLNHLAVLKGISSKKDRKQLVDDLLHRVNLYDVRKKNVSTFSGGMKQRFGIAQALIGQPKLIIVDEPTAGLDPGERNRFYNLLAEIGEQVVVILSTHIVQDVRELCSQMAIIDKGKLRFSGSPDEALLQLQNQVWEYKDEAFDNTLGTTILSKKLVSGKPLYHLLSDEQPYQRATPVSASLEDAFFYHLKY